MSRKYLVAANWKLNGDSALASQFNASAKKFVMAGVDVLVCPPYPLISALDDTQFKVGAQDISCHESGAYTGEVSAKMLTDIGCSYVICGHSERRQYHAESNELVAQKAKAALAAGLVPIICIGEPLQEREAGTHLEFVERQLQPITALIGSELVKVVIAYEPVWAIGTGKTATPEQAQEVHNFIREKLEAAAAGCGDKVRILYGGSVKANNAEELFSQPDIDGGLIGGASLKVNEFQAICTAAQK